MIVRNTVWLSICNVAGTVSSILLFMLISRLFGPAGTGEYSYAFAIGGLVALLSNSGLEEYAIRELVRADETARVRLWSQVWTTQCVQLVLGAACFTVFLLIVSHQIASTAVLVEIAAFLVGVGTARTLFVPAMASQAMAGPAIIEMLSRLGAVVCAVAVWMVWSPGLSWMLIGFPIGGVAAVALAARNATRYWPGRPSRSGWRGVGSTARHTAPFAAAEVSNQFYSRADVLLIAYLLGSANVGLYAADIKFVEVYMAPLIYLGIAAYPFLTRAGVHGADAFAKPARELLRLNLFFGAWLAAALYCLVPLLVVPLLGRKFAPAEALLPWVALFAILKSAEVALYRLLYAVRRQALYAGSLIVGTALVVVLNLLLIPRMGLTGAITALIISNFTIDLICVAGLRRAVGLGAIALAFAGATVALAATLAAVAAARHLGAGPWVTAFVGCVSFPVFGVAAGLLPRPRDSHLLRHRTHLAGASMLHPPPPAGP